MASSNDTDNSEWDETNSRRIALFKLKKDPPGRVWVAEIFVAITNSGSGSGTLLPNSAYDLNAAACLKIKHGLREPKVSAVPRVFTTGKQKRTPVEQAMQECSTLMRNKITRNGYAVKINKVISEFTPAAESVMSRKIAASEATNTTTATAVDKSIYNNADATEENVDERSSSCSSSSSSVADAAAPPYVMLADNFEKYAPTFIGPHVLPGRYNFHVQPKLDGIFCLMNAATGEMFSRARKPLVGDNLAGLADEMLRLAAANKKRNKCSSGSSKTQEDEVSKEKEADLPVWLVGELYAHGYSFQTISGWVRTLDNNSAGVHNRKRKREEQSTGCRAPAAEAASPKQLIKYHVFDVVSEWPFHERRNWLENLFSENGDSSSRLDEEPAASRICLVHNVTIKPYDETGKLRDAKDIMRMIDDMYDKFVHDENYEGAMIHVEPTLPPEFVGYIQAKRVKWLLKYKKFLQEEFLCMEVKPQEHNKIKAGSVELQLKPGCVKQFSATIAMPDSEKKKIWKDRHLYEKGNAIATVKFFCYTDGGVPRFPQLIGFRHRDDM